MDARTARRVMIGFFILYAVALTYPGILPFNRIEPLILGLPFTIFWGALWVALSFVVLVWLLRIDASTKE